MTNDVDDGIKEFTCGYHICYKISLVLILGGYLKVREYLYTQVVMNYIDTVRVCLPSFEGSCMVGPYALLGKKQFSNVHILLVSKNVKGPHYRYPNGVN